MSWGGWINPKDARGRESRTLAFVGITWMLLCARFVAGGFQFEAGPLHIDVAATSMIDFGAAVAAVLAIWVGREWVDAKRGEK